MVQKEMAKQRAVGEDDLENVKNFIVVRKTIEQAVTTRQKTIKVLRQKAIIADAIHQGCALSNRDANLTGAFGGVAGILAGGITIATGGLAVPFGIAALTSVGAVCSVGGGAWSVKNEYDRGKRVSDLQEDLSKQLAEDEENQKMMEEMFEKIKKGDFGKPHLVFRELHTVVAGLGGIATIYGSTAALEILTKALPKIATLVSSDTAVLLSMIQHLPLIAGKGALEGMEEAAEQSASAAVKCMHNGFSKDFVRRNTVKAAQKAYKEILEETLEGTLEKAAQEAVKKAAERGANEAAQQAARQAAKEAATKAAKKTATKAANAAASRAVQEGAKTAAKVTGLVTVGFGAFTSLWEGYNAYQNHYASQGQSELGTELRVLADLLEEPLSEMCKLV
jgi:hypothetical protein